VAIEPVLPCIARGIASACRFCATGAYGLCENFANGKIPPGLILGFTRGLGGGFGEYVVAHRSQVFALPDTLPNEQAVLIDPIASAFQPVASHLPANEHTVLVFGAGIIGLNAIQSLRACGFTGRLLAIARHDFQAEWCKKLGADEIIRGGIFENVAKLTGATTHKPSIGPPVLDGGVDQVFDCVGSSKTVDTSMRLTRKRGKVVVIGTTNALSGIDACPFWFKEVTLIGSSMYDYTVVKGKRQRTYQHVIDGLVDGCLTADGLLTHTFSLKAYRQAFATALQKKEYQSIKVAFQI
jgi:erythritol/L-threitol dehydrogenase